MSSTGPVLVIHGGAGDPTTELAQNDAACREALRAALEAGRRALDGDGDAVAAVQAAVAEMESCELFNAGRGSALCSDGSVQMSAALMRGSDRAAGAVAGLTTTEHPIAAARHVLDSPQMLMVGQWADRRAGELGIAQRPNEFFVTDQQRARLSSAPGSSSTPAWSHSRGTVGAVCVDRRGVLAAATSTGGVFGQPPGRVGDTPVIGAGTWADEHVAVSCTGDGEAFIRAGAGRQIAMLVQAGTAVGEATDHVLADVAAAGGRGGLIALDRSGEAACPISSRVMPGGVWREGSEPVVWVTERPGATASPNPSNTRRR
jgi:L-asparaginase / beta-aspartyl-peptidase